MSSHVSKVVSQERKSGLVELSNRALSGEISMQHKQKRGYLQGLPRLPESTPRKASISRIHACRRTAVRLTHTPPFYRRSPGVNSIWLDSTRYGGRQVGQLFDGRQAGRPKNAESPSTTTTRPCHNTHQNHARHVRADQMVVD